MRWPDKQSSTHDAERATSVSYEQQEVCKARSVMVELSIHYYWNWELNVYVYYMLKHI